MKNNKEYQKMISGKLYTAKNDEDLQKLAMKHRLMAEKYNSISREKIEERTKLLKKMLGEIGENVHIESPIRVDYGYNTSIGNNFYSNFDIIFLDVAPIKIGDNVMFGPRVSLLTATHPIDVGVRNRGLEYGLPITIEDNVWIGGSVTILPGVTIGKNSIIGSGAVVVKDIPENVIAAGNPCKVIRKINEEDKLYWEKLEKEYWEEM